MPLSDQFLRRGATGNFASTHWSVVLLAGNDAAPQSAEALEALCQAYWYPLYCFVRRQGRAPHEAADLTQDFFARLLATSALSSVSPERGKFRSFLIASLKNHLANERDRALAQKRGGGRPLVSLDEEMAEDRYQRELVEDATPEKIFERRWAETILSRALERLREECDGAEKSRRFDGVKGFLLGEKGEESFASAAERLGMSVAAIKALVHRLRRRFRELIRSEVAHTVGRAEEVDEEIRHLFSAFGG